MSNSQSEVLPVNIHKFTLSFISSLLILAATFHWFGPSADSENYLRLLNGIKIPNPPAEFLIYKIRDFSNASPIIFFGIFAIIGIPLKFVAIYRLSKYIYVSVIAYLLSYFFLHDYTQIRAGVASGIFLLSIVDLSRGDTKKYFIKCAIAILFHYSALVMLVFYFFNKLLKDKLFALLPIMGCILVLLNLPLYELLIAILSLNKFLLELFSSKRGPTESIEVFNLISISYLLIFYGITSIVRRLDSVDLLLYKVFSTSLFLFYSFGLLKMPVISFRIYEFMNIVIIILMVNIASYFRQKTMFISLSVLYFMLHAYHLIFNVKILPNLL